MNKTKGLLFLHMTLIKMKNSYLEYDTNPCCGDFNFAFLSQQLLCQHLT